MSAFLMFAQGEGGGQIQEVARTFGVDWSHLISQIISFSIVCVLLYLFAYKPILRMLAERRQLIAQGLANSEKIKAELMKTEIDLAHAQELIDRLKGELGEARETIAARDEEIARLDKLREPALEE